MAEKLNILFITADQWRGECLSALGHEMVKTPNLDALAADGVKLVNWPDRTVFIDRYG